MGSRWRTRLLVAAACGFVACEVVVLSTLLLDRPTMRMFPVVILLFVGVFPVLVPTVLLVRAEIGFGELRSQIGLPRTMLLGALLALNFLIAVASLWRLRDGGPYRGRDGQFFLDNHGQLTGPVSAATYHAVQLAEQRLFTAMPAAFCLLAIVFVLGGPVRASSTLLDSQACKD